MKYFYAIAKREKQLEKDAKLMVEFRQQMGWSQTQAAEKLGYEFRVSISRIENSHSEMSGPAKKLIELYLKYRESEK